MARRWCNHRHGETPPETTPVFVAGRDVYQLVETSDLNNMSSLKAVHYYQGLHFRYQPAILSDTTTTHKYIIAPQVSQGQGSVLVNAFNTHIPPPLHPLSTSHQYSPGGAGLNCVRRQHRGRLSFLRFLGPTSKTQRLKLGISEQLESLFNYVCGRQACHQRVTPLVKTPRCCLLRGSQAGVKPSEAVLLFLMNMYVESLLVLEQLLLHSCETIEGQVKVFKEDFGRRGAGS